MMDSGHFPPPPWSALHWNVLMYKYPPFPDGKKAGPGKRKILSGASDD